MSAISSDIISVKLNLYFDVLASHKGVSFIIKNNEEFKLIYQIAQEVLTNYCELSNVVNAQSKYVIRAIYNQTACHHKINFVFVKQTLMEGIAKYQAHCEQMAKPENGS